MQQVAENQGVYCFKAYDPSVSGVDMTNADFRAEYCMNYYDVSHLNLKGHKLVMPKFESFIAECYENFTKADKVELKIADLFHVQATNGTIHISAYKASKAIFYDDTGKQIMINKIEKGDNAINLPTGALYIILIDSKSYKVCL